MNKKIIFLLLVVVLLGTVSQAQDSKRLRPNLLNSLKFGLYMAENNLFEARFILHLKNELGLTPAQVEKIENMMLAHEEASIRRGSDIKVLELKFAALLKNNSIDRREMEKMARDIGKLKTDLQVDHLNYLLDIRDILSPEQIQKIEKFKKDIPGRIRDRIRDRMDDFPPPHLDDDKDEPPFPG